MSFATSSSSALQPTRVRVSLNQLIKGNAEKLMEVLAETDLEIKRVINPRRAWGGDDLVITGDLQPHINQIAALTGKFISIKYEGEVVEKVGRVLEEHGIRMRHHGGNFAMLFGTAMVPISEIHRLVPFPDFDTYFKAIHATAFGSKILPFLPVKPRGAIFLDEKSIELMLPTHGINILRSWIMYLATKGSPTLKELVEEILYKENPLLRQTISESVRWIRDNQQHILQLASKARVADYLKLYLRVVNVV